MIGKCVFAIAFGVLLWTTSLSQKPIWRTEHRDSLLVAPKAKDVTYKATTVMRSYGSEEQDELTYTVEVPYPASDFLDHLYEDLQKKGWTPDTRRDKLDNWIKPPADSRNPYVCAWIMQWQNANNEFVSYQLEYRSATDKHLRTLYVHAYAAVRPPPKPSAPPVYPNPRPTLRDRLVASGALLIYILLLVGSFTFLTRPNVRSAVFYGGPSAWITWINLLIFAPIIPPVLSLGEILLAAILPPGWNAVSADAFLVVAIWSWIVLASFSKIGYVACAIVLFVTARILLAESLPKKVKIAHALLGFLSLSFFVVCIVYFSEPLIRW